MTTYELIDQTGERFGRNRQWLIVISDGHRKRGFCTIPLWEDFPASQLKADAQHVLRQLQAEDEITRLRAQVAGLVNTLRPFANYFDGKIENVGGGTIVAPQFAIQHFKDAQAAIAAAESEAAK